MDVRTLLICCRTRLFALRAGAAFVFMFLLVAPIVTAAGCGFFPDFGTLSSTPADDLLIDPVDLSGDGSATCDVSYHHDSPSYGFNLDIATVEATGWSADADATFAGGWNSISDGATILITTQVVAAPYPADLAVIVEAANEQITLSGGTIGAVFELILTNGDDAIQTNYVLGNAQVYRVDVAKNDRRFTLRVSVAEGLLTQTVDNAMVTTVTSLCVD